MTDYSNLSDFEINKLVAIATGHKQFSSLGWQGLQDGGFNAVMVRGPMKIGGFDPCNNPADAWPIIVGNKLSLINADDKWLCVTEGDAIDGIAGDPVHIIYSDGGVEHENPLRAAMIVFLMMQGKKE